MKLAERGMTIMELIVSITVIGILTVLMMNFVAGHIADNAIKNAQSDLQLQTQLALDTIDREIRQSANIDGNNRWEDAYPPTSDDAYSWSSDADTIILADPVINTSDNVVFEDPQNYISYKDNVIYYLNDATLYKRILAAPVPNNKRQTTCPPSASSCIHDDPLLAAHIENFSVTYYDANEAEVTPANARAVKVSLKVSRKVFKRTLTVEQSVQSVFRNR